MALSKRLLDGGVGLTVVSAVVIILLSLRVNFVSAGNAPMAVAESADDGPSSEGAQAYEKAQEELTSMLHWAIKNSDPEVLRAKATEVSSGGAAPGSLSPERIRELRELMGTMSQQKTEADLLTEAIEVLNNPTEDVGTKSNVLEIVEDIVSQIDMANDFANAGGVDALMPYLTLDSPPDLRGLACQVLAAAASNNVVFQERTLSSFPGLPSLLIQGASEGDASSQSKALFLLSALLGNSHAARESFVQSGGGEMLLSSIGDASRPAKVRKRCLTILTDFLEHNSTLLLSGVNGGALEYVRAVRGMLATKDWDLLEKALMAIAAMARALPESTEMFVHVDLEEGIQAVLSSLGDAQRSDPDLAAFLGEIQDLAALTLETFASNDKAEL